MGFGFRVDEGISAKSTRLCIGSGAKEWDEKVGITAGRQGKREGAVVGEEQGGGRGGAGREVVGRSREGDGGGSREGRGDRKKQSESGEKSNREDLGEREAGKNRKEWRRKERGSRR